MLVGTLKRREDTGAALRERMGLAPLSTLQDALGLRQRLSRIRLTVQPGRDLRRVEASLSRALAGHPLSQSNAVIVSKIDTGSNTDMLYGIMMMGLALTGAVTCLAAALLIINTFAMNVAERTREIGILRSLGMDRGGVLRGVLVEAALLGAVGTLVGLPLGWGLAQGIVRALVVWQRLEWEQLSLSMAGLIGAPVVGMGVALGAAWWPARRAAQVSPLAAIHPHLESRSDQVMPWTWKLGAALLIVMAVVVGWLAVTPQAHSLDFGPVSIVCLIAALVTLAGGMLLLPPMVSALTHWLRGLVMLRLGVVGRLAGDQLERHRHRTTLTAGTLAVGVAMLILLSGTVGAMVNMAEGLVFGLMKEKLGIMAYSTDESFEASNPMSLQRQKEWPHGILTMLDSLRDRAYVYGLAFSEPVKEMEGSPLSGVLVLDDLEAFLRVGSFRYDQGDLETAIRIIKRGRAILVTPSVARRFNLSVGGEFVLTTRRGRVPFYVAAVGANPWWAPVVSRADAEAYLGASIPIGYFVTPRPGVETDALKLRMQDGLRSFPQYKLFDFGPGFTEAMEISIGRLFGILTGLLNGLTVLALVIASLGQVNTMMASVLERVRELAVLRSVGLTREQVQRLVLLEAAAVGVIGAVVGTLVGTASVLAYLIVFYTAAIEGAGFGSPTWASVSSGVAKALSTTQWLALFALGFAPLITMFAAWLPARRAANLPIIEALRDEAATLHRKRPRPARTI
jgi:putative ABC transport system permease protein